MLKNCGHGAFEDLTMIVHLVLSHWTRSWVGCPRGGRTGKWASRAPGTHFVEMMAVFELAEEQLRSLADENDHVMSHVFEYDA
jgi:hypothetical protein